MHVFVKIYEFAASAGAFEGYVYPKEQIDSNYLPNWVNHLYTAYELLPEEVRDQIQPSLDGTLGRAIRALIPRLGEDHEIIRKLRDIVKGELPTSVNDFQKKKWFE